MQVEHRSLESKKLEEWFHENMIPLSIDSPYNQEEIAESMERTAELSEHIRRIVDVGKKWCKQAEFLNEIEADFSETLNALEPFSIASKGCDLFSSMSATFGEVIQRSLNARLRTKLTLETSFFDDIHLFENESVDKAFELHKNMLRYQQEHLNAVSAFLSAKKPVNKSCLEKNKQLLSLAYREAEALASHERYEISRIDLITHLNCLEALKQTELTQSMIRGVYAFAGGIELEHDRLEDIVSRTDNIQRMIPSTQILYNQKRDEFEKLKVQLQATLSNSVQISAGPNHERNGSAESESKFLSRIRHRMGKNIDEEHCPSRHEVIARLDSFILLKRAPGLESRLQDVDFFFPAFAEFVACEPRSVFLCFWVEVERYRAIKDVDIRNETYRAILDKYLDGISFPAKIKAMMREKTNLKPDSLDDAQGQVVEFLTASSYAQFIRDRTIENHKSDENVGSDKYIRTLERVSNEHGLDILFDLNQPKAFGRRKVCISGTLDFSNLEAFNIQYQPGKQLHLSNKKTKSVLSQRDSEDPRKFVNSSRERRCTVAQLVARFEKVPLSPVSPLMLSPEPQQDTVISPAKKKREKIGNKLKTWAGRGRKSSKTDEPPQLHDIAKEAASMALNKRLKVTNRPKSLRFEESFNAISSQLTHAIIRKTKNMSGAEDVPSAKVVKEGYLLKRSTNIRKTWKRRWFILNENALYYVQELDKPVLVTKCLLATVRETDTTSEFQFSFEILSPNKRTYMLQAESEMEMQEWLQAIRSCTENLITGSSGGACDTQLSSNPELRDIQQRNSECADCGTIQPVWASINLGVVLCIECSGIHRSLGVHVSKVRSLILDSWTAGSIALVDAIGNNEANLMWEASKPADFSKPKSVSTRAEKERFVRMKYCEKAFLNPCKVTPESVNRAAANGDAVRLLEQVIHQGLQLFNQESDSTPLHLASMNGHVACCEILLQNNGKQFLYQTDANGMTPLQLATQEDVLQALTI